MPINVFLSSIKRGRRRLRMRSRILPIAILSLVATTVTVASAGPSAAAKASGTPIVFGVTCELEAPSNNPMCFEATKAYFDQVNAEGGVHGHPLELQVCSNQT